MHWWGKDEETFCRLFPRYIQQSDITESLYDSGTFFVIIQQCKNKMCCILGGYIFIFTKCSREYRVNSVYMHVLFWIHCVLYKQN